MQLQTSLAPSRCKLKLIEVPRYILVDHKNQTRKVVSLPLLRTASEIHYYDNSQVKRVRNYDEKHKGLHRKWVPKLDTQKIQNYGELFSVISQISGPEFRNLFSM